MNYPVWGCYIMNGGLIIALISIIHVYLAHFAIGGSLFLVSTEYIGFLKQDFSLIKYLKYHTTYFFLLTMVLGSLTGVWIWFCVSVVSPASTSILLNNFVFIWAIEWLFFIGEIITLILYWYCFDKIDQKQHIKIGIFYCIFSWLSLFAINGIISFMLTPGDWIETVNIWDGFFNPTMLPSLGFRTFMATMLAGIFGLTSSLFNKNNILKAKLINWCTKWILVSLIFSVPFLLWYMNSLTSFIWTKKLLIGFSPEAKRAIYVLCLSSFLISILTFFINIKVNITIQKFLSFTMLLLGLVYIGSFEWYREASRRPYLIPGYIYSNSVLVNDKKNINNKGILKYAKWVKHDSISEHNILEVGREIFKLQCLSCHSIGGFNDILKRTINFDVFGLDSQISGQGKLREYMPEFFGTSLERMALSRFITEELHQKDKNQSISKDINLKQKPIINSFDEMKDSYLLLGASRYGINDVKEYGAIWSMLSPPNIIYAQLILRGEKPQIISDNITLTYNLGKISGKMTLTEDNLAFYTDQINILLNLCSLTYDPYPLVTLIAKDNFTETVLAKSQIVMPISTEIGCKNCHGGEWNCNKVTGISKDTVNNILKTHDKISGTKLFKLSTDNNTINCKSCHNNNPTNKSKKIMNLSASIHGFHAVYLSDQENKSCNVCHSTDSQGITRSFRGLHNEIGLECINCHSSIKNFAISLLKYEASQNNISAKILLRKIKEIKEKNLNTAIMPRKPWVNLPDCLNCHHNFTSPEVDEHPTNRWTQSENVLFSQRADESGVMCISCHGSPHALYPSINPYFKDLDNMQMLKYQNNTYPLGSKNNCKVCHITNMIGSIHHFKKH